MQRFVLQENIKLLARRLATAASEEDRGRIRGILAAVEREMSLLDAMEAGVLRPGGRTPRVDDDPVRARLIAEFRETYGRSPKLASLIDPAPGLVFVDVNATYCASTGLSHREIVGRSLFDRFPENPDDLAADGLHNFFMSLRKVAATGQPDTMALLRYDVQDSDGAFRERYWRPTTSPLTDAAGELVFLLQEVEEVTDEILQASRSA
ncbi:PAS domain-containing protein [Phenylobacterium sp.]|uniref:PAS domain-containing protein n=1 Tax=Phenylobacterium sp. TaxID=1871053 RepID=UPI00374DDE94